MRIYSLALRSDPCIGYIVREIPRYELTPSSPLPRKLVLLGDTYDPSPLIPLIHSEPPFVLSEPSALPEIDPTESGFPITVPVSRLVHEATDAYLPPNVDPQQRTGKNRTQSSVEAKTRDRGHSTPAMAGAFARRIGAERLVLNHIGARYVSLPFEFVVLLCLCVAHISTQVPCARHGTHAEWSRQIPLGVHA